jgi:hypothetical protein
MFDFCFELIEINEKKKEVIQKRKKSQLKSGGTKSSQKVDKERMRQEKNEK